MIAPGRPAHEFRQIVEGIVKQLTTLPGSDVSLKLEIDAEVPSGLDRGKVRTLLENATTLGFIDMSYTDQGFSGSFGIDDLFETSVNIGNGGFAVGTSYAGQHLGLSLNDDGFAGSAAVGIDWGPLPYAEGHASYSAWLIA